MKGKRNFEKNLNKACPFPESDLIFAPAIRNNGSGSNAEVAQLVERNLAKVEVASSSLVFRSKETHATRGFFR